MDPEHHQGVSGVLRQSECQETAGSNSGWNQKVADRVAFASRDWGWSQGQSGGGEGRLCQEADTGVEPARRDGGRG